MMFAKYFEYYTIVLRAVVKVKRWRWGYCDLQFGLAVSSCGPLAVKLVPKKMKIYKYVPFITCMSFYCLCERKRSKSCNAHLIKYAMISTNDITKTQIFTAVFYKSLEISH